MNSLRFGVYRYVISNRKQITKLFSVFTIFLNFLLFRGLILLDEMVSTTEGNQEKSSDKASDKKSEFPDVDFVKLIGSKEDALKNEPLKNNTGGNTIEQDSDSGDSDILIMDINDDIEENKSSKENGTKKDSISRPAKRKRASSSKDSEDIKNESLGSKSPPKKQSRRTSDAKNSGKKFDQVENELEAMFAGLESDPEESPSKKVSSVPKKQPPKPTKNLSEKSKSSSTNDKSTPKSGSQKPKVKEEIKQETPAERFECKVCHKEFGHKKNVIRHMATIHEKKISSSDLKSKTESKSKSTSKKLDVRRKSSEIKSSNINKKSNAKNGGRDIKGSSKVNNEDFTEQERLFSEFKGPFARVEGEISNVRWTNIINNTTDALDPQQERDQPEFDLDQVTKVTGFGYTLTTLNKNYNPRLTDESWICVFCRKPGHFSGLGDLFGPYFIDSIQWDSLHMPSPEKITSKSDLASSFILGGSDQAGAKAKRRQAQKRKSDAQSNANTISLQASGSPVNKVCQSTFRLDEIWENVIHSTYIPPIFLTV